MMNRLWVKNGRPSGKPGFLFLRHARKLLPGISHPTVMSDICHRESLDIFVVNGSSLPTVGDDDRNAVGIDPMFNLSCHCPPTGIQSFTIKASAYRMQKTLLVWLGRRLVSSVPISFLVFCPCVRFLSHSKRIMESSYRERSPS